VIEETTVDSDFLISSVVVESEKEISSLDDIMLIFVFIVFLFG
jgi:hypothetical protein